MERKREDEEDGVGEAPWRPFSCLLSMGEVTWATLILLPNSGRKKKTRKNKDRRMMGKREGGRNRRLAKSKKMDKKKRRLQNKSPIA